MRLGLALVLALPTLVACHNSCGGAGGCLVYSPPQQGVWAWGYNDAGQLGYSTPNANQTSATPRGVPGTSGIVAIAAGGTHSLAITFSGQVVAWGGNADGQLGTGTATASASSIATQMTDAIAVAAGFEHSLAVKSNGTVWAWGKNDMLQLADVNVASSNVPLQVAGLTDARAVAGGFSQSVVLKRDGTVWSWGGNSWGEFGDGSTISRSATPVPATGLAGASAVAAGGNHTIALRADGTVWAWGSDFVGQLGVPPPTGGALSRVPVRVVALTGIVAIAAGEDHSLALRSDGTVWAWGGNSCGELGDGTTMDRYAPVQVGGLPAIQSIAAGSCYSLALDRTGRVWVWGSNTTGELGNGVVNSFGSPVAAQVPLLFGVTRLAGGFGHVLAQIGGPLAQPAALTFSGMTPGSSTDLPVTIVNVGSENLTLTGLDIIGPQAGDFAVVSGIGAATRVLAPGATQQVTVGFICRLGVSSAATLRVHSSAVSSPLPVPLRGGGSHRQVLGKC